MGVVAEGGISTELAVADLVVALLVHIEVDWPVSCHRVIAESVAPWAILGNSASAIPIDL